MENSAHHRSFRVRNTDSTQSENLHPCGRQHQLRQRKNFTSRLGKDAQRKQISGSYDQRNNWCQYVERQIMLAKDRLKECEGDKILVSENIDQVNKQLTQFQNQMIPLKCEGIQIQDKLQLQKQTDVIQTKKLKLKFQIIAKQLKRAQKEQSRLKQELESLYQQQKILTTQIGKIKSFIVESRNSLIKEQCLPLPSLYPKRY